ncbi:hypothetical protein COCON_G00115060 [Conger conger]|uniref:Uncharacterized protein n=1 Tax=Conger conger TaxID=82655 RepID=A0A9Q1HYD6_CONCO|nr:hypothetical protein COCON_G00115060 [Conger conger]
MDLWRAVLKQRMNSYSMDTNDSPPRVTAFMHNIPETENTYSSINHHVYTCLDKTAPSNRSTEPKSSAGRSLDRKASLIFVSLWLITLITLIVGLVLYSLGRAVLKQRMNSYSMDTNDSPPRVTAFMQNIPETENTYSSINHHVYTCMDETAPSNRSTEPKSSAGRSLDRKASLIFVSLWLITLITLIVGLVLY